MKSSVPCIGVLGHYGNDNLGDEAIVQAVIQNLRSRIPSVQVICISANPSNTERRHRVPAFPVSRHAAASLATGNYAGPDSDNAAAQSAARPSAARARLKAIPGLVPCVRFARALLALPVQLWSELAFIRSSAMQLRRMDLLFVAGSNQFSDNWGGPWAYPYAMLKWAWLGRMCGTRVVFAGIGAGPLESVLGRLFVRLAMLAAHDVSFRDEASLRLTVRGWAGIGARVVPDLALGLMVGQPGATHDAAQRRDVGVNPMPIFDRRYWYRADAAAYHGYVERLAEFCDRLDVAGVDWYLYATQPKDLNVMRDVFACLERKGHSVQRLSERTFSAASVDELVQRLARTDVLVATRFHGVVLSLLAGRPALGICYHRKTAEVLERVGLGAYHQDIEAMDVNALFQMFEQARSRSEEISASMGRKLDDMRSELDDLYERVVALLSNAMPQLAARVSRDP